MSNYGPAVVARFWTKVQKTDGCWLWTGGVHKKYGRFYAQRGSAVGAHRVSWVIHNGAVTAGLEVCHNCPGGDNPLCVRPDHLFLGTHEDNMKDAQRKGRTVLPPLRDQRGEKNPRSKLTDVQAAQIKLRRHAGERGRVLAAEFGVTEQTICDIARGRIRAEAA